MPNLSKALDIWEQAGHTRIEFSDATGIDTGTVSRLFAGQRGLSDKQRLAILKAFSERDLHQALLWIKADLEDLIPERAKPYLRVILEMPDALRETDTRRLNKVEKARRAMIKELEEHDPEALQMATSLYDWKHRGGGN